LALELTVARAARPWLPKAALLLLPLLATLTGCVASRRSIDVQNAVTDYYSGAYDRAADVLRPMARATDEDFVLNNVRLGSAALGDYDLDQAEGAFLRAYEVMNAFGVNTGGRTLGAVLVSESIKVWKGEPFERAMAHFYLGLVYYMRGDWNNARAAFENALFKLRDYGTERDRRDQYREVESNFVIAHLMLGKCWQKLGRDDLARANFGRVAELQPYLRSLADFDRNAGANVLLVVDYGYGPHKHTTGDGSIVGFGPTRYEAGPIPPPRLLVDGRPFDINTIDHPPIDLLALAQERRWQSIDTIRAIKSALGTGLMVAGAYQGTRRNRDDRDMAAAGVLILAGALLKASSGADLRQWEMLPRSTFVLPLRLKPGHRDVTVEFPGGYHQTWRNLTVPETGEATYYMRLTKWTSGTYAWPPPAIVRAGGEAHAAEPAAPRATVRGE